MPFLCSPPMSPIGCSCCAGAGSGFIAWGAGSAAGCSGAGAGSEVAGASFDTFVLLLSGNEQYLAYVADKRPHESNKLSFGNSDIFLKNFISGEVIRLTERNDIASWAPRFSKDGSRVCYARNVLSDPKRFTETWSIPLDGNADLSRKALRDEC